MVNVNVGTIQDYIDMGRLPTDKVLTLKDLVDSGMIKASAIKHGVKLLADGKNSVRDPIQLQVSRASQAAIEAIERIGGEVTTVHYNRLALRALLKPDKFQLLPKFARPPPKLQPYYTNWENRGYLSVQAQMRQFLKKNPELEGKFEAALGKSGSA